MSRLGVSFAHSDRLASVITMGLALHNIPEGLAISLVLVRRGVSPLHCALWSIASSLPQPIMAIPALLSVQLFSEILPWGLGFACGAMLAVSLDELIPEARTDLRTRDVFIITTLCMLLVLGAHFFLFA